MKLNGAGESCHQFPLSWLVAAASTAVRRAGWGVRPNKESPPEEGWRAAGPNPDMTARSAQLQRGKESTWQLCAELR